MTGQTPILDEFLASIANLVRDRNGAQLQDFLQIEPPLPPTYERMIQELHQQYPPGPQSDTELQRRCEPLVPKTKGGSSWTAFPSFMRMYFTFLRDVNVDNLLETYNLLRALLNQCVLALGDSQNGVVVLETVLYLSKVLARLAMGLDRRPELIAHVLRKEGTDSDASMEKVTLVEKSANVVREAFIKCLTDRSGATGRNARPEGKRKGIYLMANLCLKLLFQCGKLRNAEQMFASISAQSPPLEYFPASQRVTYLYYLGRYLFANNMFYFAKIALQASYNQCHRQAFSQKRLILTYLIPCNIVMGRFPSQRLLHKPEAEGLGQHFEPLCRLIVRGDYLEFRKHLDFSSPTAQWFAKKGLLLTLRNRCEILVWRSLCRKVFVHAGFHGDPQAQAQRGPPPYLYLEKLAVATRWLQTRHKDSTPNGYGEPHPDSIFFGSQTISLPFHPEFAGLDTARSINPSGPDFGMLKEFGDYLAPAGVFDEEGGWHQNPENVLIEAVPDLDYTGYQMNPVGIDHGIVAVPRLLRGYLTHSNPRFAIPGARLRGALPTGFPNVSQTILEHESGDDRVPGWVQPPPPSANGAPRRGGGGGGGGRVVNLSGAKPVGMA
ncbi:hypothetical protein N7468_009724 [Penicillium chermesinum]|uniref:PCI domain-containing protein n=1 Tax=Penicillium chermesinum TaxID=63820 RepID=A0A9W9TGE3_9EURO|nr:uncharacterized protein N7468_009724 [Penicillium chermesinum]KAJ5220520.1 hypothetical protein N7468_009724 [Penicillium chermesinum]